MDGPRERDDPQGPALQPVIGLFFAVGKEARLRSELRGVCPRIPMTSGDAR